MRPIRLTHFLSSQSSWERNAEDQQKSSSSILLCRLLHSSINPFTAAKHVPRRQIAHNPLFPPKTLTSGVCSVGISKIDPKGSGEPQFRFQTCSPEQPTRWQSCAEHSGTAAAGAPGVYWAVCCLPPASRAAELCFYT